MKDSWKDHNTAQLVNDLRDCAIKFGNTAQLRERIAEIIHPLHGEIKDLKRLLWDSELVIDAAKEEITKQTNRAAIAEQELELMIRRWKTANKLNTEARNELAKIKLENNL